MVPYEEVSRWVASEILRKCQSLEIPGRDSTLYQSQWRWSRKETWEYKRTCVLRYPPPARFKVTRLPSLIYESHLSFRESQEMCPQPLNYMQTTLGLLGWPSIRSAHKSWLIGKVRDVCVLQIPSSWFKSSYPLHKAMRPPRVANGVPGGQVLTSCV